MADNDLLHQIKYFHLQKASLFFTSQTTTVMKKFLLQAILPLFAAVPIFVFAQDIDEHSAEYQWGERNALWVILAVIVIIIVVIRAVRRKKKGP